MTCSRRDSNPAPSVYKPGALPIRQAARWISWIPRIVDKLVYFGEWLGKQTFMFCWTVGERTLKLQVIILILEVMEVTLAYKWVKVWLLVTWSRGERIKTLPTSNLWLLEATRQKCQGQVLRFSQYSATDLWWVFHIASVATFYLSTCQPTFVIFTLVKCFKRTYLTFTVHNLTFLPLDIHVWRSWSGNTRKCKCWQKVEVCLHRMHRCTL